MSPDTKHSRKTSLARKSFKAEIKISSQQLTTMQSEWTPRSYQIKQHSGGEILTEQVFGQAHAGFGIHQTGEGWSVTHLKTGWATFISGTEEGAKLIADYLIDHYSAQFERLNISGCTVENFRLFAGRIETDQALWNLRRLYVVSQQELNRRGREAQPKLKVLS